MSKSTDRLLELVLEGGFYLVGEYRASYVGTRDFVDKTDGKAKGKVVCNHLIEIANPSGVESVKLFQGVPLTTTDPSQVHVTWEKGKRYAFPLLSLSREKGRLSGLFDSGKEVIPL